MRHRSFVPPAYNRELSHRKGRHRHHILFSTGWDQNSKFCHCLQAISAGTVIGDKVLTFLYLCLWNNAFYRPLNAANITRFYFLKVCLCLTLYGSKAVYVSPVFDCKRAFMEPRMCAVSSVRFDYKNVT